MSQSASEKGLTLVEVTVALVVSGILIVGLVRFFRDFNRSYNNQEQVADRDQNAHYTVKRLSEAFMAAGANLPAKGWAMINMPEGNPGPRLVISVNPRGGVQYLAAPLVNASEIPVDDAKGFSKAAYVLADPQAEGLATQRHAIDRNYNADGFAKGIKPTGTGAIVRLTGSVTLDIGDAVYAYDEEDFRLQDGNLTLDGNVLAENIQNLTFTVLTSNQTPTGQWSAMRSGRIKVTARTRAPDPNYDKNDGYRTLDLSMDVLLRNRL
jgi:prepilin-type N-terminal cleavage/methylation domain-containing protein